MKQKVRQEGDILQVTFLQLLSLTSTARTGEAKKQNDREVRMRWTRGQGKIYWPRNNARAGTRRKKCGPRPQRKEGRPGKAMESKSKEGTASEATPLSLTLMIKRRETQAADVFGLRATGRCQCSPTGTALPYESE